MISASIDLAINAGLCRNTDPSSQVWVNGVGEALLGQSQEGAETPPRSSSSGLLDDLHSRGMSGKPPPLLQLPSRVICRGGSTQSGGAQSNSRLDSRAKEEHLPFHADLRPPSSVFGAGVVLHALRSEVGASSSSPSSVHSGSAGNQMRKTPSTTAGHARRGRGTHISRAISPRSNRLVGYCLGEACSQDCSGLVSAGCCVTSGLRYVVVVLASAFWWVSQNGALVVLVEVPPESVCVASTGCYVFLSVGHVFWPFAWAASWCRFSQDWLALFLQFRLLQSGSPRADLGAFGGGSPQSCPVVALVVTALSLYRDELSFCAGGTSCVPVVKWFASLLAPCVLSQMVVWERPDACLLPLFSVGCSRWWCLHMEIGAVLRTVATFVAK
ncbi:hypothetical protein Taro_055856, partial [Colocasia esculenta]|nr:hypothetical protein [Colocasia esculenta]